jgi:hypothetical protein
MYYDLKEIKVLDGFKMFVRFEDQKEGTLDLSDIVNSGGVFSRLKDRAVFEQARIDEKWAVLCWPGEIDIAPETLYKRVSRLHVARG